jgi:16S rRNA (cytosine967-C5)-methyltransferase
VDAPCTGLGVLRRHPDIRWRRHPEDVTAASVRQATILRNASLCVADGGVLVYAVCSPEPEEGIAVAVAHAAASGWRIEEVFDNGPEPRIPEGASLSPASERLRQAGGDVFWACRMVRREEPSA